MSNLEANLRAIVAEEARKIIGHNHALTPEELDAKIESGCASYAEATGLVDSSDAESMVEQGIEDADLATRLDLPDMDDYVTTDSIYEYVSDALSNQSGGESLSTINDHLESVARGGDCGDGNPFRAAVVSVVAGLMGVDDERLEEDYDRIGAYTRTGSQRGKIAHLFGGVRPAKPQSIIRYGQSLSEGETRWCAGLDAMRSAYRALAACSTLDLSYNVGLGTDPINHGIRHLAWSAAYTGPDSLAHNVATRRPKLGEMVAAITTQRGESHWARLAEAVAISRLLKPIPCTDAGTPLGEMEARTLSQAGSEVGALYVLPSLPRAQVSWGAVWGRHGEHALWSGSGLLSLRDTEVKACKPEDIDGTRRLFDRAGDWQGIMIPGAFSPWGDDHLSASNHDSGAHAEEALRTLAYAIGGDGMRSWEASSQPSWNPKPQLQRALNGGMVAL